MQKTLLYITLVVFLSASIFWLFSTNSTLWDIRRSEPDFMRKNIELGQWFQDHRPTTERAFLDTKQGGYTWFRISDVMITTWKEDFIPVLCLLNMPLLVIYLVQIKRKKTLAPKVVSFLKVYLIVVTILIAANLLMHMALSGGSVLPGL